MCYIFEKDIVWGPQKQCSQVSDIKIYKYKYTNTQIQFGPKSSTTTSSSSSNYKSKFPNFAQNNFCFFDLIFTIICFPTLSKKFFWKKLKNVNVTSHHQAIINNNIIIRSWNISSKLLFLHSSQQVGVQILLVQPHSKTSKQRKTHPHKIICVQYLQQCKNVARIMFMFKTKSRW